MSLPPEEIARLIDAHWVPLVAWVGMTSEAEDIVQQTFIALAGLTQAPNNPRAWLYTAARNQAINARKSMLRRQSRQEVVSKPEQMTVHPNSRAEASELRALLRQLPSEQREVVVAKIWGQLTFDEIAIQLGISKATVWRIYKSALASLRSVYDETYKVKR